MIKNIIIIVSVAINVLLYNGTIDVGQYRNYVDDTKSAIQKSTIQVNTPVGSFSGKVGSFSGKITK